MSLHGSDGARVGFVNGQKIFQADGSNVATAS